MKKRGFTLVELLAVIVILAIILAIAIPGISGIVKSTTRESFKSDAKMVLKQLDYGLLQNSSFNATSVTEENIGDLKLSNDNYETLSINIVNNKPYILIVGKNKWNGLKVCGTIENMKVVEVSDEETCIVSDYIESEGVNKPKLATGMIPVKWVTDHWVTTTESDADWYQYGTTTETRNWANVIQVTNPESYTTSGTTVTMSDVIAMWVWIPRYIYNISGGWHEQMTSTTGGTIEVQFSMNTDDTRRGTVTLTNTGSATDSKEKWTSHPAFNFGDDPVTGIWVAKFEASNDGSNNINIKPNVSSWRGIAVNDIFNKVRSMELNSMYGWGDTGTNIDTHMTKNIDWGAVVYLTQSTYGKNAEVWINPANDYTTGCAGDEVSSSSTDGCLRAYNTPNGQQASTTGNIYGIYDMSGGAWEYVSAYIDNSYADDCGNSITNLTGTDVKYKDVYDIGLSDTGFNNYEASKNHKGDAVYETSGNYCCNNWYDDYLYMPKTNNPWFLRSNHYAEGSYAGLFQFDYDDCVSHDDDSFRPVVLVGTGL